MTMNTNEALDLVKNLAQHLPVSISAHQQIQSIIAQVQKDVERSRLESESADLSQQGSGTPEVPAEEQII